MKKIILLALLVLLIGIPSMAQSTSFDTAELFVEALIEAGYELSAGMETNANSLENLVIAFETGKVDLSTFLILLKDYIEYLRLSSDGYFTFIYNSENTLQSEGRLIQQLLKQED